MHFSVLKCCSKHLSGGLLLLISQDSGPSLRPCNCLLGVFGCSVCSVLLLVSQDSRATQLSVKERGEKRKNIAGQYMTTVQIQGVYWRQSQRPCRIFKGTKLETQIGPLKDTVPV